MRPTTCKHFTGVQNDRCDVGIAYADFPKGALPCLPRFKDGAAPVTTCGKREYPTAEEIAADAAEDENTWARVTKARAGIVAKHGKARGLAGDMPCPNACGGTLHYSIARSNGHIHAGCSTAGCCAWME